MICCAPSHTRSGSSSPKTVLDIQPLPDPKSVPFRFTHRVCHANHSINTSTYCRIISISGHRILSSLGKWGIRYSTPARLGSMSYVYGATGAKRFRACYPYFQRSKYLAISLRIPSRKMPVIPMTMIPTKMISDLRNLAASQTSQPIPSVAATISAATRTV